MKKISGEQIKIIHAILNKLGMIDEKAGLVSDFTNGRTTSSREMTFAEAFSLTGYLRTLQPTENSSIKMRNKILSMAHELGWELNEYTRGGKKKIDMNHLNNWCIKHGHAKKKLDKYTNAELPMLVSQMEVIYKQHLTKV